LFLELISTSQEHSSQSVGGPRELKSRHIFQCHVPGDELWDQIQYPQQRFAPLVVQVLSVAAARKRLTRRGHPPQIGLESSQIGDLQVLDGAYDGSVPEDCPVDSQGVLVDIEGSHDIPADTFGGRGESADSAI
jgi:hypothetical protein